MEHRKIFEPNETYDQMDNREYYEPLEFIVPEADDGIRLDTFLRKRIGISRRLLTRLKKTEKGLTVNGERSLSTRKVQAGDRVQLYMEQESSDDIMPQPIPLNIIYEDEHLLVLNKQAGIIVHPTHGHYIGTLANGVVHYWQQQGKKHRFRPVHRLDEWTSGVLIVAKNHFAHQHIHEQMLKHEVVKRYVAIVHGHPPNERGTIDAPIMRNPENPHVRITSPEGDPAVTHYEVVASFEEATFVSVHLETGRTHQIRVHLKHIGCPIIGDPLYGSSGKDDAGFIERQALHAEHIRLRHPLDNRIVSFDAPIPDDMRQLMAKLDRSDA